MDTNIRELERVAASGSPDDALRLMRARERADGFDNESIVIDGEVIDGAEIGYEIAAGVHSIIFGDDPREYIVAESSEVAGQASRERWAEMAEHDAAEFRAMVGDEALIAWALGQYGGPGSTQVKSLDAWLDLHLDVPEEEFAGYDGEHCDVDRVGSELADELGFVPTVAYRSN